MAARTKFTRLESEIEKHRSEGNWSKAIDTARQVSSKSPALEQLASLVFAEGKLERFLLENPPNEENVSKAQDVLPEVKTQLLDLFKHDVKAGMKFEVLLLLAKADYAMGDYNGALSRISEANIENMTLDNVSNRKLRIIAEAYAIKGLCLDKVPLTTSSKFKQAERDETIIECFEKAGDICIVQLQEIQYQGKATPNSASLATTGPWNLVDTTPDSAGIGPVVETAIQQAPILHIRKGEISHGIGQFREILRAVETRAIQGLRQTLARQLAEVLLRGVCENNYAEPKSTAEQGSTSSHNASGHRNRKTKQKPEKYVGADLFTPETEYEEVLLLLLISESIATRDAVLSRSTDHHEARNFAFLNTTAVYDLLTITLVRRAQYHVLTETFERAMKFSFDEFHIWYQFALSLVCAEKYHRAKLVLNECMRLAPKNTTVPLLAARLCYEHLHRLDEGIEYARHVTQVLEDNPMLARGYCLLGIGYGRKAEESRVQQDRQHFQMKALQSLKKAHNLDKNDYLAAFHLSLQLAILRQIPEAMMMVHKALQLKPDDVHSLHLLALLLSAQKQYEDALVLIEAALAEYPDNFNLMFTKCRLDECVYGTEDALHTCRRMMHQWKQLFEAEEGEHRSSLQPEKFTTEHRSLLSDRDSGSVRGGESIAASHVEHALSEVASSIGSSLLPKHGPQHTWTLQAQIWLQLTDLYVSVNNLSEAQACITEASTIFPVSYMLSYMKGRLHEAKGELHEAKSCYQNAIAINPVHVKSLQYLGVVLHQLGNNRMAAKVLRDAVSVEPTSHTAWHHLGSVLEALSDFEAGMECLLTATELEASSPILPFTVIPRALT